jgi:ABC-type glycerol-3-phosphate transport system permease component
MSTRRIDSLAERLGVDLEDGSLASYAVLLVFGALIIFPFYWMVATSIKSRQAANAFPPELLPTAPTLTPYVEALQTGPWVKWFLNTTIVAGGATVGVLLIATPAAYALSRRDFPGSTIFFGLFLSTMMIPPQVIILPLFRMFSQVGLIDSYLGLILCYVILFTGFSIFLLNGFFKTLPSDVEDAAKIGGIAEWKIFLRIILPLAKPGIATAGLFVFVFSWNEFLFALIFLQSDAMYTISLGLSKFQGVRGNVVINQIMAVSTLAVIPVLALFILSQDRFIEGISGTVGE